MNPRRAGPRFEFRAQEAQRVQVSPCISEKFRKLKKLTVDLQYYDDGGTSKSGHMKYSVNLDHAKSVFRFSCPNNECVRGDFDLSEQLAEAIGKRRTSAIGELSCQGWRSKTTIHSVHCRNVLHYALSLGY